ncbi:cyclic AMP-dependent transcription factor ATF-1 isoform X3 [Peromyscus maniculatus bairdii]
MEDSHKSNTPETAPQPGSTVQGTHISQIAHQVSSFSESEESQDSSDSIGSSQKAHGILARRPSYRKILKDLSSEDTRGRKGDGESPCISAVTSMSVPTPIYQTSSGQYIAIAPNGALQLASPGTDGVQGLQTLAMTNSSSTQQGTILQYAQTSDGQQILVPSNQVVVQTASGDMQTYQIRTTPSATSLPQTVVMTSPVTLTSQTTKTDDPQLKREIRLMKNRLKRFRAFSRVDLGLREPYGCFDLGDHRHFQPFIFGLTSSLELPFHSVWLAGWQVLLWPDLAFTKDEGHYRVLRGLTSIYIFKERVRDRKSHLKSQNIHYISKNLPSSVGSL